MSRSTLSGTCASAARLIAVAALAAALAGPAGAQTERLSAQAEAPAAAPGAGWSAPRDGGATLRIIAEDATSVTVEVTASWDQSLASALASAAEGGLTPVTLAAAATDGRTTLSQTVGVGGRTAPTPEIVSEDIEWEPLPAGARLEALVGPLARVENVSELRRQMVGTLVVALVRAEDAPGGGQRVGRLRRAVVRVSRPALRAAFAAGADNPHLAVTRSVLADGTWRRIAVPREGVYRLTAAYLRDSLGIATPDLGRVQVYGNGGRILPAVNTAPRPADLREVPTLVQGSDLLFFGEGPSWWDYTPAIPAVPPSQTNPNGTPEVPGIWSHDISPFSDSTHYFVRVDAPSPRRLDAGAAFPGWPDAARVDAVTEHLFHERDLINIERDGSGSGLDWFGEDLTKLPGGLTLFDGPAPPGIASPVRYRARVGTRTDRQLTITMSAGGETLAAVTPGTVILDASNIGDLLRDRAVDVSRPAGASLGVTFRAANSVPTAQIGALDWVEAVYDRAPVAQNGVLRFATPGGRTGRLEIPIQGFAAAPEVWDVTESGSIRRLGVRQEGGAFLVQVEVTDLPREMVAFDAAGAYVAGLPRRGRGVPNQNLHGLGGTPAYVVVAHPAFIEQATRLADYRRTRDGLEPVVVSTDQIDNEFASGSTDMRAIRDYLKFLYDRAPTAAAIPRYLLLFGDGHFDYRRINDGAVENFVPVYETENMISRSNSYTSDDYFGLLADGAGLWQTTDERVQLGIGRLPVRTAAEASDFVGKIELYESPASLGAWRSTVTFVGDDNYPNEWDHDLHVLNADGTARVAEATDPTLTVQKIYTPTYPLVNTVVGNRRPAATEAVLRSLNEGTLIWNYSGHGSPENLGDERYFTEDVLNRLDNRTRPAIFVTATCSFGKFDLEVNQSLAEQVLLRPQGGGIAMFTTVRLVYTSQNPTDDTNFGLNVTLTDQMLRRDADGRPRTLGDALFSTKNTRIGASFNNRKFNLLGDPAMRIGLPEQRVQIETPPTFRAYDEATVSGQVLGADGQPDAGYSGVVDVQVYDAQRIAELPRVTGKFSIPYYLRLEPGGPVDGRYTVQTDAIYAGRATVTAGQFQATFRVPQDVSYSGLPAKVFVYGVAGARDASGASRGAIVSAQAGTRPDDATGPDVRLFIGDTTFVSGGIAPPEAVLVARISDASGINTVGAGVGHELLLTIDGDDAKAVDVGRYFAGDLDNYRAGTIRFPLPRLAPGPHTARLTAWDAVNNSNTAEVQFLVTDAEGLEVRNLFPYPNPTAGPTRFTFEHNLPAGTPAKVQLRVYTINGRVVRTIDGDAALPGGILPAGLVQIPWDGRDDDFDRLATGVYLFRLRVEAETALSGTEVVERVERVAIIR